jgi:flagellar L-ring protein FlgH
MAIYMMNINRGVCIALLSSFLIGCTTPLPKRDPAFSSMRPPVVPVPDPTNGAIFQAGFSVELFTDRQAKRVGDILTVQLLENITGETSSATDVNKTNNTLITNPTIFGQTPNFSLPGSVPLTANTGLSLANSLASSNSFAGDADTKKSNKLTGDIGVTVVEVYPNGNLFVRGEKRMTVNQGVEYIRLSGIVRSGDIGADNTVVSTKVVDATIRYVSEGQDADANKMGWLARFFNSPIFPF